MIQLSDAAAFAILVAVMKSGRMRQLAVFAVFAAAGACGDNFAPVQLIALVSTPDPLEPGELTTWSNEGESVIASGVFGFSWSPDRQWVASTTLESDLTLWSLDDESATPVPDVSGFNLAWSPDGSRFFAPHRDGGFAVVVLDRGPSVTRIAIDDPIWTLAGNLMDSARRRWCDSDGGQCRDIDQACSMSRDDQVIACLSPSFSGVELRRRDGTVVGTWDLPGQLSFVDGFEPRSWSYDSAQLALMRRTPFNDELWIGRPGSAPKQIASFPVGVYGFTWSPDGRYLSAHGEERTWIVRAEGGVEGEYPPGIFPPEFSPDGARLAIIEPSVTRLVDIARKTANVLPGGSSVTFSRGGRYMQIDAEHVCSTRTLECTASSHQWAAWFDGDHHLVLWGALGAVKPYLLVLAAPDGAGTRTPMFDGRFVQSFQVR